MSLPYVNADKSVAFCCNSACSYLNATPSFVSPLVRRKASRSSPRLKSQTNQLTFQSGNTVKKKNVLSQDSVKFHWYLFPFANSSNPQIGLRLPTRFLMLWWNIPNPPVSSRPLRLRSWCTHIDTLSDNSPDQQSPDRLGKNKLCLAVWITGNKRANLIILGLTLFSGFSRLASKPRRDNPRYARGLRCV